MSDRGKQLFGTAEGQITELQVLLSTAAEAVLRNPCPGREKLGDGTVGAVAGHIADTYLRIAAFADGADERAHAAPGAVDHGHTLRDADASELFDRLTAPRRALSTLADLTDEQLDTVPAPGQARFCDGQRTLEQVVIAMLRHQSRQIDAVRAAIEGAAPPD